MKKISKSAVIINALTDELPVNETWYQERLAICNICEKNSANSENGVEGLTNNLIKIAGSIAGISEPQCNACGCFITKKASQKEEECGMTLLGQPAKWSRLMVHTVGDDFNIYNNSPEKVNIDLSADGSKYVVRYIAPQNNNSITNIQLLLEGEWEIEKLRVSCGCTQPTHIKMSENLNKLNISLNMSKIALGEFTKTVYVDYNYKGAKRTVEIKLEGKKDK